MIESGPKHAAPSMHHPCLPLAVIGVARELRGTWAGGEYQCVLAVCERLGLGWVCALR